MITLKQILNGITTPSAILDSFDHKFILFYFCHSAAFGVFSNGEPIVRVALLKWRR
jgi:hypothetical protein